MARVLYAHIGGDDEVSRDIRKMITVLRKRTERDVPDDHHLMSRLMPAPRATALAAEIQRLGESVTNKAQHDSFLLGRIRHSSISAAIRYRQRIDYIR